MTQDEINMRSKVLAEFEGLKVIPCGTKRMGDIKALEVSEAFLKYHTSWEELHRVWEKFRDISAKESKLPLFELNEWQYKVGNLILNSSTLEAFTELSDAIEWLNSIQK